MEEQGRMSDPTSNVPSRGLPPGPKGPPLLQTWRFLRRSVGIFPGLHAKYGDTFTLRINPGPRNIVVFSRPEDIKEVFAGDPADFHAGEGNSILRPVMGKHSVLLTDDDEHMRARTHVLVIVGQEHRMFAHDRSEYGVALTSMEVGRIAGENLLDVFRAAEHDDIARARVDPQRKCVAILRVEPREGADAAPQEPPRLQQRRTARPRRQAARRFVRRGVAHAALFFQSKSRPSTLRVSHQYWNVNLGQMVRFLPWLSRYQLVQPPWVQMPFSSFSWITSLNSRCASAVASAETAPRPSISSSMLMMNFVCCSIMKTTELCPSAVLGPSMKYRFGKPWIVIPMYVSTPSSLNCFARSRPPRPRMLR